MDERWGPEPTEEEYQEALEWHAKMTEKEMVQAAHISEGDYVIISGWVRGKVIKADFHDAVGVVLTVAVDCGFHPEKEIQRYVRRGE